MSLLTDNRMHRYVEPKSGRLIVHMSTADEVMLGETKFVRLDKYVKPVVSSVEVKPAAAAAQSAPVKGK